MFTQAVGTTSTGFEGLFRYTADIQGLGTSVGRHPSADLLQIFNASYRELRTLVTGYDYTQFVTRGSTTSLPTSAVEVGEQYATITLAAGVEMIKKVDIKIGSEDWTELDECTLLQLRDNTYSRGSPRRPRVWCWIDSGSAAAAVFTPGKIAVAPVPTSGSYALWTMSTFTDLALTTDIYAYHNESWRQWHLYHAMAKVCGARDKDTARKLDFVLTQLNPEVEGSPAEQIKRFAPTKAGPKTWTRSANYRAGRR
jgi:hypothetical protein